MAEASRRAHRRRRRRRRRTLVELVGLIDVLPWNQSTGGCLLAELAVIVISQSIEVLDCELKMQSGKRPRHRLDITID
ncbi:hypothetical protein EJB05_42621 [Eragrostis curvula]|uniref:Uncharacterized protein n=1 Tax=Eragrostis curvula TaxID=38414 RepID=A0A5J9TCW4_9POAL|nr:hypothetical protein EJB05_42621 [Eragrostis curvula]